MLGKKSREGTRFLGGRAVHAQVMGIHEEETRREKDPEGWEQGGLEPNLPLNGIH